MNDDIQRGRSPNSPKYELSHAIDLAKKLYEKIGRSAVKADVALGALGYKGFSGAALGTIGAISQYGLIDRSGGSVQITPLALRIIHPIDEQQKASALREAALTPKVFAEIHEHRGDMAEDALANHLIHQKFTPDAAKRAASVFKANSALANLGASSISKSGETRITTTDDPSQRGQADKPKAKNWQTGTGLPPEHLDLGGLIRDPKVLATFKIPLGFSEAELVFTGDKLEAKDFDDLKEYVDLFKKQYVRRTYPAKGFVDEKPVVVEEEIRTKDGALYYRIQGREDHVPASQVFLA